MVRCGDCHTFNWMYLNRLNDMCRVLVQHVGVMVVRIVNNLVNRVLDNFMIIPIVVSMSVIDPDMVGMLQMTMGMEMEMEMEMEMVG